MHGTISVNYFSFKQLLIVLRDERFILNANANATNEQ